MRGSECGQQQTHEGGYDANVPHHKAVTWDGQIADAHSISAGLDYPGVGPEHAALRDEGRASYLACSDAEALEAFHALARSEGIIPALESSHALARALDLDAELILVCLSGRRTGDGGRRVVCGR